MSAPLAGAGSETLRGGSWYYDRRHARVSYRDGNWPATFRNNVGFRVVLSPNFHLVGKTAALRRAVGQER